MAKNKDTKKGEFKLPLALKALSIALILCPIGNFLISFRLSAISQQIPLSQIADILPLIPAIDWIWNGLIALSGVLILLRRKLSWLIAIVSILICTAINLYKFFTATNSAFGWGYIAMTFTVSMAAVLVIGYFRYPYLDRRDRWTKVNRRSKVQFPVEVDGQTGAVMATDISLKGAQLKFSAQVKCQEGEMINLSIDGHTVSAKIIWINSNTVGVAFVKPSREFKKWLRASLV